MVIVINGMPTSGKSTFVELCKRIKDKVYVDEYSTVDFVKEIARKCGWDEQKTPKNRKFLSDLKDLLTEWKDVPFQKSVERIREIYDFAWALYRFNPEDVFIFIHCREPHEIQRFKDAFGDYCTTLLIRRPTVETDNQSNHADGQVFDYKYEHTIVNDGSLEELEEKAQEFIQSLRKI